MKNSTPLLLWKNIQEFINLNKKQEFNKLLKNNDNNLQEIIKILINNRIKLFKSNNTSLQQKFSLKSTEFKDINVLVFSIFKKNDTIACLILDLLRKYVNPIQYKEYLSHTFNGVSAIHLAAFYNLSNIIKSILELDSSQSHLLSHNHLLPLHCTNQPDIILLFKSSHTITKRPSLLLKKATDQFSKDVLVLAVPPSPLSSTSTITTTDSILWTPPTSPLPHKKKSKKVNFQPDTILIDICTRGDQKELIETLCNPIQLDTIKDIKNRSLLHIALMYGNEHLVYYLCNKINVNHTDVDGWTCLHYAAALGLWKSLEFLSNMPNTNLNARTLLGLKIQDCPQSDFYKRKTKLILQAAINKRKL